jgi:integrase
MTAKLLTARAVELAKPGRNATGKPIRAEISDAACPGLYLIVQPSGTRSWALRYRRPGGSTAKLTLGRADADGLNLAQARHAATAARLRLDGGEDPKPKRLPIIAYSTGAAIEAAIAQFLELHARRKNRLNTIRSAERVFARLVLPAWRGRAVHDIKRRDVIELIDHIAASGRGYLANRALGVLSKFFNWLRSRDVIEIVPTAGVVRPHQELARTRVLTDDELRRLWLAAVGDGPFGSALCVLLLSAARRNEISHMRWDELDQQRQLLVLKGERTKNGVEHAVPLSGWAWEIIQAQPRFEGCPYVFSANGKDPVVGWDKAKKRLSEKAGIDEKSWRLHDLRRSAASSMQRLGIPIHLIERCLNHVSGTFGGIVGVYQTYDYSDEMRGALQRWADHVERLVTSKPAGRVVKLRTK